MESSKIFDDTVNNLNALQAQFLEPANKFNQVLTEGFEQYAQLNYEVLGDLVDYSIAQSKLSVEPGDITGYFDAQKEIAGELTEKLKERGAEYATLATSLQNKVKESSAQATPEPVKTSAKTAKSASKKAA